MIGDDLFGEIDKLKKIVKISPHQIKTLQSFDIPVLEIAKLFVCQIVIFEKPPNIHVLQYAVYCVLQTMAVPLHVLKVILGGRHSPAVACWASDHWVASSNLLQGKFRHYFRLIIPGVCLAQFSLNNVHKGGLKHHHFLKVIFRGLRYHRFLTWHLMGEFISRFLKNCSVHLLTVGFLGMV